MAPTRAPDPDDDQDFKDADQGFITSLNPCIIKNANGDVIWDNDQYSFITGDCPPTAKPSLWRQSQLCYKQGLYLVTNGVNTSGIDSTKGIYQFRGFDISNMTIVETLNGIIIVDPLISQECAAAALSLYSQQFPTKSTTVMAMIFSHSHVDHFGGAEGVLPPEGERDNIPIIAPDGFMEHAVSENVYAGNAMTRRATYMYGNQIPTNGSSQIGTGLGMIGSTGTSSFVKPSVTISRTSTKLPPIDGVNIVFQVTPGTEAPSEMNFYFPDYRALCMAENATHTMHNIQTLRGALVRDAHVWSRYLDEAIQLFADDSDAVFASHNWPKWGTDNIRAYMTSQRDMYAFLNDQTLRMLNNGMTGLEIAETFELPYTLANQWYNQGFYGSISHNVKAIYNRYMGWYDGNPAHLWEWPPVEAGKFYIECMGTVENVISLAGEYKNKGNLRFAATLLSHAVFGTSPSNTEAMAELAAVLEQLGFGSECGPWRNFYLTGASELKNGIQPPVVDILGASSLLALSLDQLMDTMAIRLDFPHAEAETVVTINFLVTDGTEGTPERILLTLSNCTLTNHAISVDDNTSADLYCTLSHADLVDLVLGVKKITDIPDRTGSDDAWTTVTEHLTIPDPSFPIVTP